MRVVRERDGFVVGSDAHERDYGAEDLRRHHGHRRVAIGQDRGLEELARTRTINASYLELAQRYARGAFPPPWTR